MKEFFMPFGQPTHGGGISPPWGLKSLQFFYYYYQNISPMGLKKNFA
jgi:hypothetical protein